MACCDCLGGAQSGNPAGLPLPARLAHLWRGALCSDSLCESCRALMSFQELQQALYGTAAFSLRIDQNAGIVRRLKFKEIFSEIII